MLLIQNYQVKRIDVQTHCQLNCICGFANYKYSPELAHEHSQVLLKQSNLLVFLFSRNLVIYQSDLLTIQFLLDNSREIHSSREFRMQIGFYHKIRDIFIKISNNENKSTTYCIHQIPFTNSKLIKYKSSFLSVWCINIWLIWSILIAI